MKPSRQRTRADAVAKPSPAAPIGAKKIALLHVAKRQLGLDDDVWRDLLRDWGRVESSADLTEHGFTLVMYRLEQLGFQSTFKKKNFGDRRGMATASEVAFIRSMWKQLHADDEAEAGLNAWLEKYHKVSALRFVDAKKAGKAITALKAMVARQTKCVLKGF